MPVQGIGQTLELTSVSPNRGVPGTPVRVTGGPFSSGAQVFFGAQLAATVDVRAGALTVIVPPLQPGSYALSVQDGNEAAWQSYTFEVLEPSPLISSISPRNIDACSDSGERRILVEGRHFLPGSALLLDGAAVAVRDRGRSRLEFDLPRGLQAGVYGVQVRNPGGASSLPHSLWVNNIPEIFQVELGNEYVNHYEVIIRGRNFYYNSTLTVSQPGSVLPDLAHRPLTLHAHEENLGLVPNVSPPQSDRLIYRDCQTLIYYRYPPSTQENELVLQVINPDGKNSEPFSVSLP
jgi:hypothetical protein